MNGGRSGDGVGGGGGGVGGSIADLWGCLGWGDSVWDRLGGAI